MRLPVPCRTLKAKHSGLTPILYVAKANTSSVVTEIKSPFKNRDQPMFVLANGDPLPSAMVKDIVDAVLPEHRHLVYQSTNEPNAKDVEKRLQNLLGLKWGYLYHGIGYGGISAKKHQMKKKVYVVYVYEYHRAYELLAKKVIKFNPEGQLASAVDGPGAPPDTMTEGGMEALHRQMEAIYSEFPEVRQWDK